MSSDFLYFYRFNFTEQHKLWRYWSP